MVRSENIELSIKVPSFCYLEGAGGQVISWRFPSNFQLGVEKKSGKMMRLRCTFKTNWDAFKILIFVRFFVFSETPFRLLWFGYKTEICSSEILGQVTWYVLHFQWLTLAPKFCSVAEQQAIQLPSSAGEKAPFLLAVWIQKGYKYSKMVTWGSLTLNRKIMTFTLALQLIGSVQCTL